MRRGWLLILVLILTVPAAAGMQEDRIPLREGKLRLHDLNHVFCQNLGLPDCPMGGSVDLKGGGGEDFVFAVNACLWGGCSFTVEDGTAVLKMNWGNAPDKCDALGRLARVWAAEKAPAATAAQARNWGLLLPPTVDVSRPMVVLIHGLDADRSDCQPMGELLRQSGHQLAYFSYPGDQAIADSAALLARNLNSLRQKYPTMPIEIVAHSMGGLVARDYIEGPAYAGGVDHLIMVATPNRGSKWAHLQLLLSIQENYHLRHDDPNWNWTWMVTNGIGQAGNDLLPGSDFLKRLNRRPRRADVKYTIVAGSKSGVSRVEASSIQQISDWIPARARSWWGFRSCYNGLTRAAIHYRQETGDGDGPVSCRSARLDGVKDFVVMPADHLSLYMPMDGRPPAAWDVIRARLAG
jgi:pimeloyl-ACP methyl ester carboxylesterase